VANDAQTSALFSNSKNPYRIPVNMPPVFRSLWPRRRLPLIRLMTNGHVGLAPYASTYRKRQDESTSCRARLVGRVDLVIRFVSFISLVLFN